MQYARLLVDKHTLGRNASRPCKRTSGQTLIAPRIRGQAAIGCILFPERTSIRGPHISQLFDQLESIELLEQDLKLFLVFRTARFEWIKQVYGPSGEVCRGQYKEQAEDNAA